MLKELLDRILDLHKLPTELGHDGLTYTSRTLNVLVPPYPASVTVHSLGGLADVIEALDLKGDEFLINVESHSLVRLLAKATNEAGNRRIASSATLLEDEQPFKYGNFYNQEDFLIQLQTKFIQTTDIEEYLLPLVSSVKAEAVATSDDDGVTQTVAVSRRGGAVLRDSMTIKRFVNLSPRRTFPEVQQPESQFLFRVKGGGANELPKLAIFEADGGRWKLDAVRAIQAFLQDKLSGIEVVA